MELGNGETIFDVGTKDDALSKDDYKASVTTLQSIATAIEADCVLLIEHTTKRGLSGKYLIRLRAEECDFVDLRVAVVGNVDAGKSTLLGVLTHGVLDNGRGFARNKLFRHKHEIETGRTSSVGNYIFGFDSCGNVVNQPKHGCIDWVKICSESTKVITFIDLAGHEKYLKTTVFGMTGHAPDFCMLMVGANSGIVGMTKEHLTLALALHVPVFVVVTKVDMCPPNVLKETLRDLCKVLKSRGCGKCPILVKTKEDVVFSALNLVPMKLCPIFQVSNVSGQNLDLLKDFLNLLTTRVTPDPDEPAEFRITESHKVPGFSTVVSGTTMQGTIRLNDKLLLGPHFNGEFTEIEIKQIHRRRMPVEQVRGGQGASFALKIIGKLPEQKSGKQKPVEQGRGGQATSQKKTESKYIRKGMVLVSPLLNPTACKEFEAEILLLHHSTTVGRKYEAVVHCGGLRQTAGIYPISEEYLRTGDRALAKFTFKKPEYIKEGQRLLFRERLTRGVGNVVKIVPHISKADKKQTKDDKRQTTEDEQQTKKGRGSRTPKNPKQKTS